MSEELQVFTIPLDVRVLDDAGELQRVSLAVFVDRFTGAILASFVEWTGAEDIE